MDPNLLRPRRRRILAPHARHRYYEAQRWVGDNRNRLRLTAIRIDRGGARPGPPEARGTEPVQALAGEGQGAQEAANQSRQAQRGPGKCRRQQGTPAGAEESTEPRPQPTEAALSRTTGRGSTRAASTGREQGIAEGKREPRKRSGGTGKDAGAPEEGGEAETPISPPAKSAMNPNTTTAKAQTAPTTRPGPSHHEHDKNGRPESKGAGGIQGSTKEASSPAAGETRATGPDTHQ